MCNVYISNFILSPAQSSIKKLIPMLDRILVKRAEAIATTKGGILIPEKSQAKTLEGTVIAVGPGARNNVSCVIY